MRDDMPRVIVERPRIKPWNTRKGRSKPWDEMPWHEGMRRPHALRGDRKELNENLAPLRRYLMRQVGRPWDKVYSEIARHLRVDSTVQQHVRDHLHDFVAVKPRRVSRNWLSHADLWWQPFYVDPASGLLCRTDRLPEAKARRRARRNNPPAPVEHVTLGEYCELRLISGLWYHVQLAPLPKPEYRARCEVQTRYRHGRSARRGAYKVELNVHHLITPPVRDVVTDKMVAAGPETDDTESWSQFRLANPTKTYAISKRTLSRRELRRHGLSNKPPKER